MMVNERDDKLIDFDPKYPYILPEDWKEKNSPSALGEFFSFQSSGRIYGYFGSKSINLSSLSLTII